MKITKTLLAIALATGLSIGASQAFTVTLQADSSFDGIATSGQVPIGTAAGNSVIFGTFATLNNAAISGFNAGGVSPGEVGTLLGDFIQIGQTITTLDFGPGTDGLFFETINLADHLDAPVPANGTTFANYQATFAGTPVYMIVQTPGEIGVYTSGSGFPPALDTTLFTDFDSTFGVGSAGLAFNPLIGANPAVSVGSLVDTQGGGAADGMGAFTSTNVVTTAPIIIPEPSRAMLLLIGVVGLVARRRRSA